MSANFSAIEFNKLSTGQLFAMRDHLRAHVKAIDDFITARDLGTPMIITDDLEMIEEDEVQLSFTSDMGPSEQHVMVQDIRPQDLMIVEGVVEGAIRASL